MPKRAAEDSEAKDDQNDLLSKAIKHCWGDSFLDVFRAYFSKHAHKFEVIAEGKTEEHSLEYQELFDEYLLIFEGKLEEFIEKEGSTINEFYTVIRDHQGSTDPQVQLFINCLLASADYDSFFSVMKKEALKLLRQRQLGGNESKATAREEKDAGELGSGEGKVAESRHDLRDEARSYK